MVGASTLRGGRAARAHPEDPERLARPAGGRPRPRSTGGITNHNFRVTLGGGEYVVRVHGRDTELLGIDRVSERLAGEAAAALGIAPALAAALADCLVTALRRRRSRPGDRRPRRWLRRRDRAARCAASTTAPSCCPPASGCQSCSATTPCACASTAGSPAEGLRHAPRRVAERIGDALPLADPRPCHNDLLAGNLIRVRDDGRLLIVDWEYAGMGHPAFDLGNLSVNNDFDEAADEQLLSAYHDRPPTDAQRAAADADARALRRTRGLLGRAAGTRSPSWSSTSSATPVSTSSAWRPPPDLRASRNTWRAPPRPAHPRSTMARPRELPDARPRGDRRRRRRRRLDRLPPGRAGRARRGAARSWRADQRLDLPLRRPRRPAAARASP